MAGNVQKKLTMGIHPLSYLGVNAESPPNSVLLQNQDPNSSDWQNFIVGDIWINENGSPNPPNPRIWMLGALARHSATWILIASGAGGDVTTLTGNTGGAVAPLLGNINVVGDGTTITIAGNPGTHTLTVSAIGTGVVSSFVTDNGTANPIAGVIDIFGQTQAGASVKFSGATNVIRLNLTDASNNTLMGISAGNATLTGTNNTGIGQLALHGLTSGSFNNAFGISSLQSLTTGSRNISDGPIALQFCTTGSDNNALGYGALNAVTTGNTNLSLGTNSFNGITTGSFNIGIGSGSGSACVTGTENSNIYINNVGVNGETNTIRIGTFGGGAQQQNLCIIAGTLSANALSSATTINSGGDVSFANTTNTNGGVNVNLVKTRNGAAVQVADGLGEINFIGFDGTSNVTAGSIRCVVSAGSTVAANRVAGTIQFYTHQDVSTANPIQRGTIDNTGLWTINTPDSGLFGLVATSTGIKAGTNLYAAGDDGTGAASTTSITNVANVGANGAGVFTILSKTANNLNSTGFLKVYVGTTPYFIPLFSTATP